ncbi:MAG: DUF481 domain-containing protein [Bacteroidetes bacterium]|nr:DUF481 domain-containing protein [Bacteroidota bacterium]
MRRIILILLIAIVNFQLLNAQNLTQSLSFGTNLTQGNSEIEQYNFNYKNKKRWGEKASFDSNTAANSVKKEGTSETENYILDFQYNQYLTNTFYWLINSKYEIDNAINLERRWTSGGGIGITLLNNELITLDLEDGISYLNTQYRYQSEKQDSAYRASEKLAWHFNSQSKFWQTAEYLLKLDDHKGYLFNAEIGIETSLVGNFTLKMFIINKYVNEPAEDKKKNDLQFRTMLVYGF